jgi:hypothetical protein
MNKLDNLHKLSLTLTKVSILSRVIPVDDEKRQDSLEKRARISFGTEAALERI